MPKRAVFAVACVLKGVGVCCQRFIRPPFVRVWSRPVCSVAGPVHRDREPNSGL